MAKRRQFGFQNLIAMLNRIIYILVITVIAIQFFGIDTDNPPIDERNDFFYKLKVSDDTQQLIKSACYDCHSDETVYPKYAYTQPIGWLIKDHVDEGRKHLNFSEWNTYEKKKKDHKMEECVEMLEKGEMPLKGYVLLHPVANLSDDQKNSLMAFFKSKM